MVPVWLLVPVLVLGVLVGAALGWLMRQQMTAGATQRRRWGAEPASQTAAVASDHGVDRERTGPALVGAGRGAGTFEHEPKPDTVSTMAAPPAPQAQAPEPQSPLETGAPPPGPWLPPVGEVQREPAAEAKPEAASGPPPQPEPEPEMEASTGPGPDASPDPEPDTPPESEPRPAPDAPPEPAPAPDAPPAPAPTPAPAPDTVPVEGERLDARMDDVLSELERRYKGRRVGPADAPEEPDPASRPRRPRRQP